MTQHITIFTTTDVQPEIGGVWRDDQVIMWGFDPTSTLAWPPNDPMPIRFTNDNPDFAPWPGSTPAPIGPRPETGPDRRFYVAMAQMVMPAGETALYNYTISVVDETDKTNTVQMVKRQRTDASGKVELIDPEVENHPQP